MAALKARMLSQFVDDNGQIVSRSLDNSATAIGDSRLYTGLAIGLLDCENGAPLLDSILASIDSRKGAIVRHDPLPDDYTRSDNETSLDQVDGVIFGLLERARRCPDDLPRIRIAWKQHRDFVLSHDGRMASRVRTYGLATTPGFYWTWQLAGKVLGVSDEVPKQWSGEAAMLAALDEVRLTGKQCYVVHLAFLQAIEAERSGYPLSSVSRALACRLTSGMGNSIADWFCGRESARLYLTNYVENRYHYSHAVCGSWQQPDGGGDGHPGLDALLIYGLSK